MNKQVIIGSAVVAVLAIGGSSAYAVDQHNKKVAAQKAKVIKAQSAKLTNEVKNFSTKDLIQADQTITDIKSLKFVKTVDEKRAAQVKELTADLYKAANTQVTQVKASKYNYNKIDSVGKAFYNLTKIIKGLKSPSADQIKPLTDQLTKDKKTVVDNLNKQKAKAEKKAAAAQEQAQQEAAQAETQQGAQIMKLDH